MADQLVELVQTIAKAIETRGFYILIDERLELICGAGCADNPDSPEHAIKVKKFAAKHGWCAVRATNGFTFRLADSKSPTSFPGE